MVADTPPPPPRHAAPAAPRRSRAAHPLAPAVVARTTVIVLAVCGAAWLLLQLASLLLVFVLSMVVAIALDPLVLFLQRRGLGRGAAVATIFGSMLVLIAVFATYVGPQLVDQGIKLAVEGPSYVHHLRDDRAFRQIDNHFGLVHRATRYLEAGSLETTVANAAASVAAGLLTGLMMLVFIVFLLLRGDRIAAGIGALFPGLLQERQWLLVRATYAYVGAWALGTLLDGVIGAAALGLLMGILGVPFILPVMVIYVVLNFIPTVGSVIGSVPAVLFALLTGTVAHAVILAIFITVYQQLEGALIYNKIMGRATSLSPFYVFVSAIVGGRLLGVAGAILAIPTTGVIQVAITEWLRERDRSVEDTMQNMPPLFEGEHPEGDDEITPILADD